jgi:hypothetical protein
MQISYEIKHINPIIGRGIICREKIKKGSVIWLSNQITYNEVIKSQHYNNNVDAHNSDHLFDYVKNIDKNKNVVTFNETNFEFFINNLSSNEKVKRFLDLSYGVSGDIHYIIDDGKFMNHSSEPNCITVMKDATTVALRDIDVGEILTEDYSTYTHPEYLKRILKKYDCEPDYYTINGETPTTPE